MLLDIIEELRAMLNREAEKGNLHEGNILEVSRMLDKYIYEFYTQNIKKNKMTA